MLQPLGQRQNMKDKKTSSKLTHTNETQHEKVMQGKHSQKTHQ